MKWNIINYAALATSLLAACTFAGCSSDDGDADSGPRLDASVAADTGPKADATTSDAGTPSCPAWAGTQPANTAAINFIVDDSANQTFTSTDGLAWKGSMKFDSATRCIIRDTSWAGPFAELYDDGPWSAGGHEPAGSTAGDHKFGVTVFLLKASTDTTIDYGLVWGWSPTAEGHWMWQGPNGSFTVPANSTAAVEATGFTVAAFGTIDLRLVIDTSTLAAGFEQWTPALGATVKSSGWGWIESPVVDDATFGDETAADQKFTFVMSQRGGHGDLRHAGLFSSGKEVEFVFVLGGVEYKVGGAPSKQGVTAYSKAQGAADWTALTVDARPAGDKNTFVTIP